MSCGRFDAGLKIARLLCVNPGAAVVQGQCDPQFHLKVNQSAWPETQAGIEADVGGAGEGFAGEGGVANFQPQRPAQAFPEQRPHEIEMGQVVAVTVKGTPIEAFQARAAAQRKRGAIGQAVV